MVWCDLESRHIGQPEHLHVVQWWLRGSAKHTQHQVNLAIRVNVVRVEGPVILKLLPCKDQPLPMRWDALTGVQLCLQAANSLPEVNIQDHRFAGQACDEDLHLQSAQDSARTTLTCCNMFHVLTTVAHWTVKIHSLHYQ